MGDVENAALMAAWAPGPLGKRGEPFGVGGKGDYGKSGVTKSSVGLGLVVAAEAGGLGACRAVPPPRLQPVFGTARCRFSRLWLVLMLRRHHRDVGASRGCLLCAGRRGGEARTMSSHANK